MIQIEKWSTTTYPGSTPLDAPETTISIQGEVYGHPRFMNGQHIITSPIRIIETTGLFGTVVRTSSGSEYRIGKPDPAFVKQCKEKGWHVPTLEQPFKLS